MSRPDQTFDSARKATHSTPSTERISRGRAATLALELSAGWPDRAERALLVLLGIVADEHRQPIKAATLANAIGVDVLELGRLLHSLALRGLVWTTRRPRRVNRYTLLFAGERVPAHDKERYERWVRHHFDGPRPRQSDGSGI